MQASSITGNVIEDANTLDSSTHAWGATDNLGSEGAVLSLVNGSTVAPSGTTTIYGL